MRAEQDAEIVGVEDLSKVLGHRVGLAVVKEDFTYVHGRVERQALNEEHGVLESILVRHVLCLPDDADFLRIALRDEAASRTDLVVDRRGGVDGVRDGACLARVLDLELGPVVAALHDLEDELALRKHVDEVRADVDCAIERPRVGPLHLVVRRQLIGVFVITAFLAVGVGEECFVLLGLLSHLRPHVILLRLLSLHL